MLTFKNRVAILHHGKQVIEKLGNIHVISEKQNYSKTFTDTQEFRSHIQFLADQDIITNDYYINKTDGVMWID